MPINFFSTVRIFYVEMAISEGGGLHIRSWETTGKIYNYIFLAQNYFSQIQVLIKKKFSKLKKRDFRTIFNKTKMTLRDHRLKKGH